MGEYFIYFAIFFIGNATPTVPDATEFWLDDRNVGWTQEECAQVAMSQTDLNITDIINEVYKGRWDISKVVPACGVKQYKFVHPAQMKKHYEENGI